MRTTASAGAASRVSASCCAQESGLRLVGSQLGFGLRDILLARSGYRQIKHFLIHIQLGFGDIQRRLRIVEILLAHNCFGGQGFEPLVLLAGVSCVSRRRLDVGSGLSDFLPAAAMMHPGDDICAGPRRWPRLPRTGASSGWYPAAPEFHRVSLGRLPAHR